MAVDRYRMVSCAHYLNVLAYASYQEVLLSTFELTICSITGLTPNITESDVIILSQIIQSLG